MDKNVNANHGHARITEVKLGELRVSSSGQREFNQSWGETLLNGFDLDLVGMLTVSHRDGYYYVVDGQHREWALRNWAKREFGEDWKDWTVTVNCHYGLTEKTEASLFLSFNKRRTIDAFDKFKVGVTAELDVPVEISRVAKAAGVRIEKSRKAGSVSAIGALEYVFRLGDTSLLFDTLKVVGDAWAGLGFDASVIKGVALVLNRYEGRIDAERLAKKLGSVPSGAKGVRQQARIIQDGYGAKVDVAHAAAITDIYNAGLRGVASLGTWWKGE